MNQTYIRISCDEQLHELTSCRGHIPVTMSQTFRSQYRWEYFSNALKYKKQHRNARLHYTDHGPMNIKSHADDHE